jgi:predicted DNA-binding transcriptional regulator YafY
VAAIPRNFELAPPKIDPKILETVQEALLSGEQLEIDYKSLQDSKSVARRLSPHALLHKGQVTYLIATQDSKQSPRTYALHRMTSAKGTNARASRHGFNLHDFLVSEAHEPGANATIQLHALINENLTKILKETPLNKTMTLKEEVTGSARITATVRDNQALHRWILGHGAAIEILGPNALREMIATTVRAAANHYA